MRAHLLSWQFSRYGPAHTRRANLALHAVTAPLFMAGCLLVAAGLFRPWLAVAGALAMATTLTVQGRGHKGERRRPEPFSGPLDFLSRFFAEQWVTFPRFVLSGGFGRAWRSRE